MQRSRGVRATWLAVALGVLACSEEPERPPPPEDRKATLLGASGHPEAFTVVFVGDGFRAAELPRYRRRVDALVEGLRASERGFVPWSPDLYRFYRVDVVSTGDDVDSLEREDTALGAYLDPSSDSCADLFIEADPARVRDAAAEAPAADAVVVIADGSAGRANAHGNVHISSDDSWRVLEHELGHALFGLGDEYEEFLWCSDRAEDELELLATPNVTASRVHPAKWGGLVDDVESGGGQWPCHGHPTESCVMLDAEAPRFCPVCETAIREATAVRTCSPDRMPPRVHLLPLDPRPRSIPFLYEAAAYDERGISRYRLTLDGEVVARETTPWLSLDPREFPELADGWHEIRAEAIDTSGLVGRSARRPIRFDAEAPTVSFVWANADSDGWIRAEIAAEASGDGELEVFLDDESFGVWDGSFFAPSPRTIEFPASAALSGERQLRAVIRDAFGRSSSPATTAVQVPGELELEPPSITAVEVAGVAIQNVTRTGSSVEITLSVESCAPLAQAGLLGAGSEPLAVTSAEPDSDCSYEFRLLLKELPDFPPARAFATDRYGRTGTKNLDWSPERLAVGDAECAAAPAIVQEPGGPYGRLRPIKVALGPDAPQDWSVTAEGRRAPSMRMEIDGSPGLLIPSTELFLPARRDLQTVHLRTTVVTPCGGDLVARTGTATLPVDGRGPSLRVHRAARRGETLVIETSDPSGVASVEARWEETVELDEAPPFELSARGGPLTLVARDRAGNVTWVDREIVLFPGRDSACEGEQE